VAAALALTGFLTATLLRHPTQVRLNAAGVIRCLDGEGQPLGQHPYPTRAGGLHHLASCLRRAEFVHTDPGDVLTVVVLTAILAAATVVAVRRPRTARTNRT
jgi:hypothetical protein